MKYNKFLKVFPWKELVRDFDLWNGLSESSRGVKFIECSSYWESTVSMNVIFFSSLSSSVMVKVGSRGIYLENVCKSSSQHKEQNFYSIFSLKVCFQGPKNPQKHKSPNDVIPYKVWNVLLDIVDIVSPAGPFRSRRILWDLQNFKLVTF